MQNLLRQDEKQGLLCLNREPAKGSLPPERTCKEQVCQPSGIVPERFIKQQQDAKNLQSPYQHQG